MAQVERSTVVRPFPGDTSGGGGITGPTVSGPGVDQSPDVPPGGNDFTDTLLALGTSHYWLMGEASGDYIDSGATGGLDLNLGAGSATDAWRQAPLLGPRGSPENYGLWKPNNGLPRPRNLGGPVTSGWTTGGIGCWFRLFEIEPTAMSLLSCTWSNNAGLTFQISVESDGRIRFECSVNLVNVISIQTAANFVQVGQLYYVHVEQPGDGTGLDMYINGVDQGLSTAIAGTATLDSFPDDLQGGFGNPSHTQFGGLAAAGTDGVWIGVVGGGYINRNVLFGATNVLNVFSSAKSGAAASDYHEFVADLGLADQSLAIWANGCYLGQNDQGMSGGLGPNEPRGSAFSTSPSVENDPDDAGTMLQIESNYARFKQIYGTNNPTFFSIAASTNWEPTANFPRGSVCAVVTVNAVPNGIRKIIFTFGTSATNSMELGVIGSVLGWQIFFRAFEATVETYRVLSGIIALGSGPFFGMISVLQPADGGGPQIYWQGSNVTNTTPVTTNPDVWMNTYGDSADMRWGGEQGSASVDNWQPGELHDMLGFKKELTHVQINELWDAVNGNVSGPTVNADTFIEAVLQPVIDFKFDEASGALLNTGTGVGTGDLPWVDGPTAREILNGDAKDPGEAIEVDATGSPDDFAGGRFGIETDLENLIQNLAGTGTFIIILRTAGWGNLEIPFTFENDSGFFQFRVRGNASGFVDVDMFRNPQTDGWRLIGSTSIEDDDWHIITIVQDGVSPVLYLDENVDDDIPSNSTPTLWFDDLWGGTGPDPTKVGVAAVSLTDGSAGIFGFTGDIDRILFSETVMTPQQVAYFAEQYHG